MARKLYQDSRGDAYDDAEVVLPAGQRKPEQRSHLMREVLETVILTALIFFVVRLTIQPYRVEGPSMEPGLHTGEWVLVNNLAYHFGSPQRGDVIVFHPPTDPGEQYIKRLIGLPGDTISITTTSIIVDSHTLKEPYIYPISPGEVENSSVLPKITLDANSYFVLGDHRQDSLDSRIFGSVPKQNIIGKAQFVMWPPNALEGLPTYSNVFVGVHP